MLQVHRVNAYPTDRGQNQNTVDGIVPEDDAAPSFTTILLRKDRGVKGPSRGAQTPQGQQQARDSCKSCTGEVGTEPARMEDFITFIGHGTQLDSEEKQPTAKGQEQNCCVQRELGTSR